MFTELVRIGFSFPSCLGGSVKFHQTSPTLDTNLGSAHLVCVVLSLSTACCSHLQSCPILVRYCLEALGSLL